MTASDQASNSSDDNSIVAEASRLEPTQENTIPQCVINNDTTNETLPSKTQAEDIPGEDTKGYPAGDPDAVDHGDTADDVSIMKQSWRSNIDDDDSMKKSAKEDSCCKLLLDGGTTRKIVHADSDNPCDIEMGSAATSNSAYTTSLGILRQTPGAFAVRNPLSLPPNIRNSIVGSSSLITVRRQTPNLSKVNAMSARNNSLPAPPSPENSIAEVSASFNQDDDGTVQRRRRQDEQEQHPFDHPIIQQTQVAQGVCIRDDSNVYEGKIVEDGDEEVQTGDQNTKKHGAEQSRSVWR